MQKFDNKFIETTVESLENATLAKATQDSSFNKIKISKKTDGNFYIEQFTQKQAFQKNVDKKQLIEFLSQNIATNFKHVYIETSDCKYTLLANKKGKVTILEQKIQIVRSPKQALSAKEAGLNRKKQYILQEGIPVPFLIHLGVMTQEGKIISAKYDKFKQINRFLEYIRDILPDFGISALSNEDSREPIKIVDFGCGKSYLTFAVYHYLHEILNLNVQIVGLDLKEDVITMCSLLAKEFDYENLHFTSGSIEDYFAKNSGSVDLVITLHACDTATDYAIASAIKQGAKAILSVPCCQHELNQSIKTCENKGLQTIYKYGIAKERFLSLATDIMRCELLEENGYSTQLLEFIDISHTPKNLLIRAVKKDNKKQKSGYNELAALVGAEICLADLLKNK